ncbi:MAG: HEAT repeat domain-containing protein [Anaerolineales bacterium]|nr:HEAT repeat domain-containing protein [Anaerolineales bacterium]
MNLMQRGDFDTDVPLLRALPVTAFPEIASLLEQSTDKHERQLCYRMLSHIAVSSRSTKIGMYAARRAGLETKNKLICQALEVAGWTQEITEYQTILRALDNPNRDVQRWAVRALGACLGEAAETRLVDILQNAANPGMSHLAAGALARMCGPGVIQGLKDIFRQLPRKPAYDSTLEFLIFAFVRHPDSSCTELVRSELDVTRLRGVGWASLNYLFLLGDSRDQERTARYLKGVFKRLKRGTTVYEYSLLHIHAPYLTEVTAALAILQKLGADPLEQFSGDIVACWDTLLDSDRNWISKNFPGILE